MAVNGIAFTLPIDLAQAAGIVIAAHDVRFRQLESGRGIMPYGGATFRAPAQLGWGNAMRFLLTAEEFGAAEALRIGLVQEVVPAGAARPAGRRPGASDRPAGPAGRAGHPGQRAPDSVAARTRRATVSHRRRRASCAARTPLKGWQLH
jgi:enoyl-CoA hydratase